MGWWPLAFVQTHSNGPATPVVSVPAPCLEIFPLLQVWFALSHGLFDNFGNFRIF